MGWEKNYENLHSSYQNHANYKNAKKYHFRDEKFDKT